MNKKVIDVLSVVFGLLEIVAMIAIALSITSEIKYNDIEPSVFATSCCLFITVIFGFYYLLAGCKKGEGSTLYVGYMGAMAVCDLVALTGEVSPWQAVTLAIAVACSTVLCFAKDLGKKKSFSFAIVACLAKIFIFVMVLVSQEPLSSLAVNAFASLSLGLVTVFMVNAKYYDKSLRNSK